MKLTEKDKQCLRHLVRHVCEECHKHEILVGTLWIHHINRRCQGGADNFRNLKVVCSECSKRYHYKEWK